MRSAGWTRRNVGEVVERGARRIVVVRALTEAGDPEAAARELRARAGGSGWRSAAVSGDAGAPPPTVPARRGIERRGLGDGAAQARPRRLRGEERDAAIRAQLEPLAPGERPRAITVAVIVAAVLAVGEHRRLAGRLEGRATTQPSTGGALVVPRP